jgi:7-cyano-7-deazaguanine synthase
MTAALVVLSGGQDSTTALFWAIRNFDTVHAITFDYGQKHRIEIEAAIEVAKLAKVTSHEVLSVPNCLMSASPLLDDAATLEQYSSYEQMDSIIGDRVELTFVPMRNPFFFTIAVNRVVVLGCSAIVTGICGEDNANYPDCTDGFRIRFQDMANAALGWETPITVEAPLMFMSKAETVLLAYSMPDCWAALAYTHTSYDGKYPPTDMNHSNVLRAHGFEAAGLPDPLVLRAASEGKMELPMTSNYAEERAA